MSPVPRPGAPASPRHADCPSFPGDPRSRDRTQARPRRRSPTNPGITPPPHGLRGPTRDTTHETYATGDPAPHRTVRFLASSSPRAVGPLVDRARVHRIDATSHATPFAGAASARAIRAAGFADHAPGHRPRPPAPRARPRLRGLSPRAARRHRTPGSHDDRLTTAPARAATPARTRAQARPSRPDHTPPPTPGALPARQGRTTLDTLARPTNAPARHAKRRPHRASRAPDPPPPRRKPRPPDAQKSPRKTGNPS